MFYYWGWLVDKEERWDEVVKNEFEIDVKGVEREWKIVWIVGVVYWFGINCNRGWVFKVVSVGSYELFLYDGRIINCDKRMIG